MGLKYNRMILDALRGKGQFANDLAGGQMFGPGAIKPNKLAGGSDPWAIPTDSPFGPGAYKGNKIRRAPPNGILSGGLTPYEGDATGGNNGLGTSGTSGIGMGMAANSGMGMAGPSMSYDGSYDGWGNMTDIGSSSKGPAANSWSGNSGGPGYNQDYGTGQPAVDWQGNGITNWQGQGFDTYGYGTGHGNWGGAHFDPMEQFPRDYNFPSEVSPLTGGPKGPTSLNQLDMKNRFDDAFGTKWDYGAWNPPGPPQPNPNKLTGIGGPLGPPAITYSKAPGIQTPNRIDRAAFAREDARARGRAPGGGIGPGKGGWQGASHQNVGTGPAYAAQGQAAMGDFGYGVGSEGYGYGTDPYGYGGNGVVGGGFAGGGYGTNSYGVNPSQAAQELAAAQREGFSYGGYGTGYDPNTGGYSGNTSGGCFITTAVVKALGEPDDGPTLTALRKFRDEVMAKRADWAADIAEYYRIAPAIAEKIGPDQAQELMSRWIGPAARAAEEGRHADAYRLYKRMVKKLVRG